MSIDPIAGEPHGPRCPGRLERARGSREKVSETAPVARARESDRVELSQEGTIRGAPGMEERGSDAARIEEVRRRVQEGYYELPEVVEEVALRILDSGVLGSDLRPARD